MSNVRFRLTGTETELSKFLSSLEYEHDMKCTIVQKASYSSDPAIEEPFGVSQTVVLIIEVASGLGTDIAYDLVKDRFREYRAERRHLRIEDERDDDDDSK